VAASTAVHGLRLRWKSRGAADDEPSIRQQTWERGRFVEPKRVFVALDGREVLVSGRRWRIEVFSVRDVAGRRWIQLALRGKFEQTFTLKLPAGAGARPAVHAVTSRLTNPSPIGDVLHVA
jgi:hypothetical protein